MIITGVQVPASPQTRAALDCNEYETSVANQ